MVEPTSAIFDASRTYRYRLDRHLHDYGNGGKALFVMLNPSTADESKDDPTIRRCKAFAMKFACTDLMVCNLYAFRATNPKALRSAPDPIGPDNERHLRQAAREASLIIAAWGGNHLGGAWPSRVLAILAEYAPVHALRLTAKGEPGHPLYVPAATSLVKLVGVDPRILHYDEARRPYGEQADANAGRLGLGLSAPRCTCDPEIGCSRCLKKEERTHG